MKRASVTVAQKGYLLTQVRLCTARGLHTFMLKRDGVTAENALLFLKNAGLHAHCQDEKNGVRIFCSVEEPVAVPA